MIVEEASKFVQTIAQMGVSAEQAGTAIQKMSKVLADISYVQAETYKHTNEIIKINTTLCDLKKQITQTETNANLVYAIQDQVDWATGEITAVKDAIGDMQYQMTEQLNKICSTEMELHDLRPGLDALIEILKQKTDLEKIEPIVPITAEPTIDTTTIDEWYEKIMREIKIII